ncbi:outer membrane beta-barrel protein [Adhaeribacter aquaticus]|uniref:outer membrane beta-barrel protein n=1 Tax=Adhaeribacter aquaticus TaxID=299567 RepID=UPI00047D8681|nr:outer membrane beta-barrel protein [Adhaeribacter aquaticus]
MKLSLPFVLFFILYGSFSAFAQEKGTTINQPRKFYIGVNYTNTQYSLAPRNSNPATSRFNPNYITYPGIHVGYMLSKNTSVQIGAAYAHENWQTGSEYNNAGSIEGSYDTIKTRGFIVPVSFRYNFLNLGQRLQFYGTSSLTAAFGKTRVNHTSSVNEIVTYRSLDESAALNMYLSLGLGANYKLGNRFNIFGEMLLLNKNLTSGFKNQKSTLNMGFNYRFH